MSKAVVLLKRLFGAVVSIAGLAIIINGLYEVHMYNVFESSAMHVEGRGENVYQSTTHGHRANTSYIIEYSYPVYGNASQVGSMSVGKLIWQKIKKANPIPIKYLANKPGQSRIDLPVVDSRQWSEAWGLVGLGLFMGGLGVYLGSDGSRAKGQ